MSRANIFGIICGYGATGSAVASELLKSCDGEILIGGRDLAKAKALAAKLGSRVSAACVDVLDALSLDEFCGPCPILINCAGPVMQLRDCAAQAALRSRSHCIDLASVTFVKERMLAHDREIVELGLSFVISAGWMPGLSELLPVYAHARARAGMDTVDSVTIYFGDSGEWSANALRDDVWYIRKAGFRSPGHFHRGEWVRVKRTEASRTADLGEPVGRGRFLLFSDPELDEVGRRLKDCDVFSYSYLSGFRRVLAATSIALLPLPESVGVRLLKNIFRSNRLPIDGFVVALVAGRSGGRKIGFTAQIVYRQRRDYWINGLVPAIAARMIAQGKSVSAGVHYLADAVDPTTFMAELRNAGVEQTERSEVGE
ncbi:MAG TPA: saccharopine dehydrogenase NADP-binding domain-containing protein [Candidatus Binatia bacterium]|nr:saccharopine dehydrogenase NADP-binding domain-containing protein [Candidatus Binatia bacterium]